MSDIRAVNIEGVESLEQYVFNLVACTLSIQTLARLNAIGIKKGLLEESEIELANTLIWECKRTAKIAQNMIDSICDRNPIEFEKIVTALKERVK